MVNKENNQTKKSCDFRFQMILKYTFTSKKYITEKKTNRR